MKLNSPEGKAFAMAHQARLDRAKALDLEAMTRASRGLPPIPREERQVLNPAVNLDAMVRAFVQGRSNAAGLPTGVHAGVAAVLAPFSNARAAEDWHEDHGPVLWWRPPIDEPPYAGTPLDDDWPGYHTHWTPIVVPSTFAPAPGMTDC